MFQGIDLASFQEILHCNYIALLRFYRDWLIACDQFNDASAIVKILLGPSLKAEPAERGSVNFESCAHQC